MSRSIGDQDSSSIGVIPDPHIQTMLLTPNTKFVVIGSDGVFDVFDANKTVRFIEKYRNTCVD
jgi:serine/threonine protein phosphatase PrpC